MRWTGLPVLQETTTIERINAGSIEAYPPFSSNVPAQQTLLTPDDEGHIARAPALQYRDVYSRPAAVKARAIDSTALGTDEIDTLFKL